ncbi:hypothetical protein [Pseudonocardia sp. T1-2H]|uniref:hypothetical protein n=1 Tax=Pseudonocardia sp. T1-2H TaxID=3128899 RepID=UPI0031012E76
MTAPATPRTTTTIHYWVATYRAADLRVKAAVNTGNRHEEQRNLTHRRDAAESLRFLGRRDLAHLLHAEQEALMSLRYALEATEDGQNLDECLASAANIRAKIAAALTA